MPVEYGTLQENGKVLAEDGRVHELPNRGPGEYLIEARAVGGDGMWRRQRIDDWIGMRVLFITVNGGKGFNFEILKEE